MQNRHDVIDFTLDDGSNASFSVLGQATITGNSYLLVTDDDGSGEEETAYILKEVREEGGHAVYEMVEDDQELDVISKVFEETLDDVEIEM